MIYDGIVTKPPMDEVIEHGIGEKFHKYIEKHKNKFGKWIYKYKTRKSAMKGDSRYRNTEDLKDRGYARAEGNKIAGTSVNYHRSKKSDGNYYYDKRLEKSSLYDNSATSKALNNKPKRKHGPMDTKKYRSWLKNRNTKKSWWK